jgi:transposase-like protein
MNAAETECPACGSTYVDVTLDSVESNWAFFECELCGYTWSERTSRVVVIARALRNGKKITRRAAYVLLAFLGLTILAFFGALYAAIREFLAG